VYADWGEDAMGRAIGEKMLLCRR